jgi:hypothetical protein
MLKQFKLIVLANAFFVFVFVAYNWVEYSALNSFGYQVAIRAHFPWNIQFSVQNPNAPRLDIESNYTLFLFLLATFVNLYLAYRIQRSKETKQNPS